MKALTAAFAALLTACSAAPSPGQTAPETSRLVEVATSRSMAWNGVAVARDGRVFVSSPRWASIDAPALALLDKDGGLQPFPDAAWNAWRSGAAPDQAFVSVNAIHFGPEGDLWVVDTGAPDFGGKVVPGGAKIVRIDLAANRIRRVYPLGPDVATAGSYVDDIRFGGRHAYLTDAGRPGIIVLDVETGGARRALDNDASTTAPANRPIVLDNKVVRAPDGSPLLVNADPLEISADGKWLYFGPLHGPLYRVETRLLNDPTVDAARLSRAVELWFDMPPVGGTAMDAAGNIYFTDLARNALVKLTSDKRTETIVTDARLHWVDAPFIDGAGWIWLPVPQMDRVALLNSGTARTEWPVRLLKFRLN